MQRPFKVALGKANAPGELVLDVMFATAPDAERTAQVQQVFLDFVGLASSGALAGGRVSPTAVSIRSAPATVTTRGASQRFSDVRLDPTAVTCLLNMLEWMHHHVIPLSTVRVFWNDMFARQDPYSVAFPASWPNLSYALEIDDIERRFQIDISPLQSQSPAMQDRINEHLGLWFTGANRGAYGDEAIPPAENKIFFGDDAIDSSDDKILWFIDTFGCGDQALDGLTNALERLHHTVAPVRSVVIG